ncbi:succinylglutamate desuccinylase/aspartoacylase family protein [Kordiimonas sp.]|uniref:succinylglutamate desuccinylase/aspartoacylase family protein n=1 Tax=Kordiimonas sp. TaxID=1970157 RepID=UPI003A8E1094
MGFVRKALIMVLCAIMPLGNAFADHPVEKAAPPLIDRLDTASLTPGRHHFYFRAGARGTGVPVLVPVIVMKGEKPGKQLLLTAAVHGDELNGIRVIHRLLEEIQPVALSGTIVAVPGVNQPGMEAHSRYFGPRGGDPNRAFPGNQKRGEAEAVYVRHLWQDLFLPGTDFAVDLHTQTTGTAYPLFVFADFRNNTARKMAYALLPEMIKNDKGEKGTLETSLLAKGVPAVTYEIGAPKRFQDQLIEKAVMGLENMMVTSGLLDGTPLKPKASPVVGTHYSNVTTEEGGLAVVHVSLRDRVEKGQLVATIYDPFGTPIRSYHTPHAGWVLAVATDPVRDAGQMLVRILQ